MKTPQIQTFIDSLNTYAETAKDLPLIGTPLRMVCETPEALRSAQIEYTRTGSLTQTREHLTRHYTNLWQKPKNSLLNARSPSTSSSPVPLHRLVTDNAEHLKSRWTNSPKHLSSLLLRPLLAFYERDYGPEALTELLTKLGTTRAILEDPNRWFSVELFAAINEAMVIATGDPDITYKAGLSYPDFMAPHERIVIKALGGFRGCGEVYQQILAASKQYSNVTFWDGKLITRNSAEITFTPQDGIADHSTFCRNRVGFLETIPTVLGDPEAEVTHTKCLHEGHDCCVYEVKWLDKNLIQQVPLLTGAMTLAGTGLALYAGHDATTVYALGMTGSCLTFGGLYYIARSQIHNQQQWYQGVNADIRAHAEEYRSLSVKLENALDFESNVSKYLSPHVVRELRASEPAARDMALRGRMEEATILFCDIVGFTPKSQACQDDPEKVAAVLNEWFSIVDPIIESHDGILDKRIGDAVMVVFLTKPGKDHPVKRAAQTSIGIQKALQGNMTNIANISSEFSNMQVRIGFAHGKVVVGNLGSKERVEFTVIGHAVNTASRIESSAPKGGIAFSEAALLAAGGLEAIPEAEPLGEIQLKGQGPTKLYQIKWQ